MTRIAMLGLMLLAGCEDQTTCGELLISLMVYCTALEIQRVRKLLEKNR